MTGERQSVFFSRVTLGVSTTPWQASCSGGVDQHTMDYTGFFFVCAFRYSFVFFPFGMWFYLFGLVGILLYCGFFFFFRKNLKLNGLGEGEDVKGT